MSLSLTQSKATLMESSLIKVALVMMQVDHTITRGKASTDKD